MEEPPRKPDASESAIRKFGRSKAWYAALFDCLMVGSSPSQTAESIAWRCPQTWRGSLQGRMTPCHGSLQVEVLIRILKNYGTAV